jgi:hypothetical protein
VTRYACTFPPVFHTQWLATVTVNINWRLIKCRIIDVLLYIIVNALYKAKKKNNNNLRRSGCEGINLTDLPLSWFACMVYWCTVTCYFFLFELSVPVLTHTTPMSRSSAKSSSLIQLTPLKQRTKLPCEKTTVLQIRISHKTARVSPINAMQTAHQLIWGVYLFPRGRLYLYGS